MKQLYVSRGQVMVGDTPAPHNPSGNALIQVRHSCVSIGTEMSAVQGSAKPLWKKALEQPEKVKKVVEMVASEGVARTRATVQGKLQQHRPMGYSAAGIVLAAGPELEGIEPGMPVACAGAQCAHHAEVISVPRHLLAPVPEDVSLAHASTVALGAIAMQGVRRSQVSLGERVLVLGLGALGQITVQMLKASGCVTLGMDLDVARVQRARERGLEHGFDPSAGSFVDWVSRVTDGTLADAVIVTAAAPSHDIISTAFQCCRRKGRVVLVGDVGLNLRRADLYAKEVDFLISTSYGPGRYDRSYEEGGVDYPLAYVRWTENRNMREYLRLLSCRAVVLDGFVEATPDIEQADDLYRKLEAGEQRPLVAIFGYPERDNAELTARTVQVAPKRAPQPGAALRVALVGPGAFAQQMHLPNLQAMPKDFALAAVVSRKGDSARDVATRFGAPLASTDLGEVLAMADVDAVLICTRHHLHGPQALEALKAGKHVLVEKPLCLTPEELDAIEAFYAERPDGPVLLTGFNRRFSPYARRLSELICDRKGPLMLNYRMNAGHLPANHWVHSHEGGGRNRGEACHIYDLFTYLSDSRVASVQAEHARPRGGHDRGDDNFSATMRFEDGSVATLTYTALGAREYPKEHLEVYVDGQVLVLTDYRSLSVHGARRDGLETRGAEKGHRALLQAFGRAARGLDHWPIPLWQQAQATRIALAVQDALD